MKQYIYPQDQLPTEKNSKLLTLVGNNKKVLEVGCAMGFQTHAMVEQQGCSVVGIEIDALQATNSRPYCEEQIIGDIETLDLNECLGHRKFDVITFADVLEHLRNPSAALEKIRPFLNDTGYVVASIPNIAHGSVIFDLAHGLFEYRQFGLLDDTHIHFFTKNAIFNTFEKSGFLIAELDRLRLKPAETEFKTTVMSPEDRTFLDYVYRMNPESETYQFVIKAFPMQGQPMVQQAQLIAARDEVRLLENSLRKNQELIRKLESEIAWLDKQPIARLKNYFKQYIGKQK